MQHIGFSLVRDGAEISRFGGIPEPYILENGDAVHGLAPLVPFADGVFLPCYRSEVEQPEWCSKTGETVDIADSQVVVTPEYASAPDVVPQVVSMRQARLALDANGVLDQVNAAIAQMDKATQLSWEYSGALEYNNPLVQHLAAQMGLDAAALFRDASKR